MNSLAIVIPAYKAEFLDSALSSLAAQSNKDFKVYVGDDASPDDISGIVSGYENVLDIKYHRFPENKGGVDLVGQWERCISLCEEEWIWLFSDDDVAQPGCVEAFHSNKDKSRYDILHFDIYLVNRDCEIIADCVPFPDNLGSGEFFTKIFGRKLTARMPEFIFKAEFLKKYGFVKFDLAWRSDTATVMSAALKSGIKTLAGSDTRVLWRDSGVNITGQKSLMKRKNVVNIQFFNWVDSFCKNNGVSIGMNRFYLLKTIIFELEYRGFWGFIKDGLKAARELNFAKNFPYKFLTFIFVLYRIPYRYFETLKE